MDPRIRSATPSDADELAALVQRAYALGLRSAYDDDVIEAGLPLLARVEPELLDRGTFYVADLDGAIVACGGWTLWAPHAPPIATRTAHLRQYATHPDHVRRGFAQRLLARSLSAAADAGASRAEALASRVAVPLYASAGLEVVGTRRIELPEGNSFQAVDMARDLP